MINILYVGNFSAGTLLPDSYRRPPHLKTFGARNEEVGLMFSSVIVGVMELLPIPMIP